MAAALKGMVRKVVEVVAPAPPPSVTTSPGPRNEPPVLGHRPGIDKVIYGSLASTAAGGTDEFTVTVNGKTYRLFFLCGHPRSGTHWMDHVLSQHPKIFITGEYRFESLRRAFDDLVGHPWHACFTEPMKSRAEEMFRESVRRILGASSELRPWADWLGDRTPRALKIFLPGAPHFLIMRDPRDIITSWAHQEFKSAGHHYTSGGFNMQLDMHRGMFLKDPDYFKKNPSVLLGVEGFVKRLCGAWRHHTREDLATLKALDAGEIQGTAMVLRYEQIHADPDGQRAAMYKFLGVEAEEARPLTEKTRSKPGFSNENPHSIYRKGEVGDWKTYFSEDVKRWFKETAGDTLIELGYEKDHNW